MNEKIQAEVKHLETASGTHTLLTLRVPLNRLACIFAGVTTLSIDLYMMTEDDLRAIAHACGEGL